MTYLPDKYWEPEDDRTEEELIAICEEDGYNYEGLELPFEQKGEKDVYSIRSF